MAVRSMDCLAVGVAPGAQTGSPCQRIAQAIVLAHPDIVQHGHFLPEPDVLEGPGHAERRHLVGL